MTVATADRSGLGRLAALAGVTCWSAGNIMVARFDMPGLWIGFWRLAVGAVLYGLAFQLSGRRMRFATLRLVAPAAIVIACEIGIFFTALRITTVANATIIGALQPIVLLAVASRRYRESVTAWLVGAAIVAIGGITLVMQGSSSQSGWSLRGDLLAFVGMFFFSAYFVFVKEIRHRVDTFTLQTASMAIGAVVLFPMAAVHAGTPAIPFPSWGQWGWLLALLAVPGTGHFLMNWAHLHVSLSLTGLLTLAIPAISGLGAWLALDEQITLVQGLGMVVVLAVLVAVIMRDARLARA
ncbi:MAG: DMT family transporter [Actinobacteria bacterium]|nr:DMT family transporter [Actinomycetota bacterium]